MMLYEVRKDKFKDVFFYYFYSKYLYYIDILVLVWGFFLDWLVNYNCMCLLINLKKM